MLAKYIFLLFSAILLVQYSNGKGLTSSNGSDDSSGSKTVQSNSSEPSTAAQSDERFERYKLRLGNNSDLAIRALKAGQKLLKDFVAEASKLEDKSEKIIKKIEECSKLAVKLEVFNQNYEKLSKQEKIKQLFNAIDELGTLLDKYKRLSNPSNPSSDDELFHDLLEESELEELNKEFRKAFVN